MSRLSRDKGAAAERAVARLLARIWPSARRRLAEVRGEQLGCDIEDAGALCVQVKCSARPQPIAALAEATKAVTPTQWFPVAIFRQSSRRASTGWMVTLSLEHFLGLMRIREAVHEAMPRRCDELFAEGAGATDNDAKDEEGAPAA